MKTSNGVNTILSAIEQICQEKKLSKEQVLEAIEQALASAYRKDFGSKTQNLKVEFDPETGKMKVFDEKTVVEDLPEAEKKEAEKDEKEDLPADETDKEQKFEETENNGEENEEKKRFNPKTEIQISDAKKIKKKPKLGEIIKQELEIPADFGRIAAQTAKQVIVQRLREAERESIYEKYKEQEGMVVNGVVQRRERQMTLIDLGEISAILPLNEQMREEHYRSDQKIKVYIISVEKTPKGPEIIVSRRHPEVLKELFKLEIPEVANGVVEIKGIAREAGARSKVAVWTKEETIDPIGACIGQRGVRIQTIISEIGGEKIDIIEYSENPEKFIINALAPAKVSSLEMDKKDKFAIARIKNNQLSLAIGREGQNVRLAAKLTGWKIDIREEKIKEPEKENLPESPSAETVADEDKSKKKKETKKSKRKKDTLENEKKEEENNKKKD